MKLGYDIDSSIHIPDELMLAIDPHKLPLGYSPQMGSDEVYPLVRVGCFKFPEELVQYMTYNIGDQCPVDDVLIQRLLLKGCEPLPRRRYRPKSPTNYVEPTPFLDSLWATPLDTSIIWDPYTCKSYRCLMECTNAPGYFWLQRLLWLKELRDKSVALLQWRAWLWVWSCSQHKTSWDNLYKTWYRRWDCHICCQNERTECHNHH